MKVEINEKGKKGHMRKEEGVCMIVRDKEEREKRNYMSVYNHDIMGKHNNLLYNQQHAVICGRGINNVTGHDPCDSIVCTPYVTCKHELHHAGLTDCVHKLLQAATACDGANVHFGPAKLCVGCCKEDVCH